MGTLYYLSMTVGIVLSAALLGSTARSRIRPVPTPTPSAGVRARLAEIEAFEQRELVNA